MNKPKMIQFLELFVFYETLSKFTKKEILNIVEFCRFQNLVKMVLLFQLSHLNPTQIKHLDKVFISTRTQMKILDCHIVFRGINSSKHLIFHLNRLFLYSYLELEFMHNTYYLNA